MTVRIGIVSVLLLLSAAVLVSVPADAACAITTEESLLWTIARETGHLPEMRELLAAGSLDAPVGI